MIEVLNVVKTEKGSASVLNLLKKSGMDTMLTELFPTNKRSSDNMKNHFVTAGLPEIVTYLSSIENAGAKKVGQIKPNQVTLIFTKQIPGASAKPEEQHLRGPEPEGDHLRAEGEREEARPVRARGGQHDLGGGHVRLRVE